MDDLDDTMQVLQGFGLSDLDYNTNRYSFGILSKSRQYVLEEDDYEEKLRFPSRWSEKVKS